MLMFLILISMISSFFFYLEWDISKSRKGVFLEESEMCIVPKSVSSVKSELHFSILGILDQQSRPSLSQQEYSFSLFFVNNLKFSKMF